MPALAPLNDPAWNPADDQQSYAFRIYMWVFDKLSSAPLFADFVCKRLNKALPIEANPPSQIPFLGVYLTDENMEPRGNINAGDLDFKHTARIGVQVLLKGNDQRQMEIDLDRAYWYIAHNIFDDDAFTNRLQTSMSALDSPRIEGFTRVAVRRRWGSTGAVNETPIGELQFEVACQFNSGWAPWDFDTLEGVTLTTAYPSIEKAPDTQQIKLVVDFPVEATKAVKETEHG